MTAKDYGCLLEIFAVLFNVFFGWALKPKVEEVKITEPEEKQIVI